MCPCLPLDLKKRFKLPVGYGHHYNKNLPLFLSIFYNPSFCFLYIKSFSKKERKYPDDTHAFLTGDLNKLYNEIEEDLDGLAKSLQKLGIVVHRPQTFDLSTVYSSPFWFSNSNNLYNVRDLNLVVGDHVIESPSYLASRYFESTG